MINNMQTYQFARFQEALRLIEAEGIHILSVILLIVQLTELQEYQLDMVRQGITFIWSASCTYD